MIDIELIRTNPDIIRNDLRKRKDNEKLAWVDEIISKDKQWRAQLSELQALQHRRNTLSQEINTAKKQGKDITPILAEVKSIPQKIADKQAECDKTKSEIDHRLRRLPNITLACVPYGKDSSENLEVRKWGKPKEFEFELKNHAELAEKLGVADFERSNKTSGTGFYYLLGGLAQLNQALVRFAVDELVKKGYTLLEPPLMIRRAPYEGVTDLADFENVMYKIEGEDEFLIATSEHPIGAMFMDETIDEDKLPIRIAGLSPCFRKEIGAHGIDEKGLFRRHQFTKIEQFIYCKPEDSETLHEELISNAEEFLRKLEIPYRVVNICTGDLGIVAAKKYDIEAWMPRTREYKEVVSGSNCTDWQARRLNIRYGKEGGTKQVLHTLNCTAIATSRTMVAILENYQNADGTVTVPKVLVPYMNGMKVIGAPAAKKKVIGQKAKDKTWDQKKKAAAKKTSAKGK